MSTYTLESTWEQVDKVVRGQAVDTVTIQYTGTKPTRANIEGAIMSAYGALPTYDMSYTMVKLVAIPKLWIVEYMSDIDEYGIEKLTIAV